MEPEVSEVEDFGDEVEVNGRVYVKCKAHCVKCGRCFASRRAVMRHYKRSFTVCLDPGEVELEAFVGVCRFSDKTFELGREFPRWEVVVYDVE